MNRRQKVAAAAFLLAAFLSAAGLLSAQDETEVKLDKKFDEAAAISAACASPGKHHILGTTSYFSYASNVFVLPGIKRVETATTPTYNWSNDWSERKCPT